MNKDVSKRFAMGGRTRGFSKEHPFDSPGYSTAVEKLEERLDRGEVLAQKERAGRLAVSAAVRERDSLTETIRVDLRLLAGIARSAAVEAVGVPVAIRFPGPKRNGRQFLTDARVAVSTATTHEELLVRFGLPQGHLTALTAALDRSEQLLEQKNQAETGHVGARAELLAVTKDITRLVQQLDSINRHRFRHDPESLAAWKTARALHSRSTKVVPPPVVEVPVIDQPKSDQPKSDQSKPAA